MEDGALRDLRWSDLTVIARDLSPYSPLIREIFPRYGIPFFLDDPRTLCGHSLSRLLLSALSIIQHDWRADDVLDYLACGLSPLRDADAVSRIQNLARRRRLNGKDWMDLAKWIGDSPKSRPHEQAKSDFETWKEAAGPIRELQAELRGEAAGAIWNFLQRLEVASRLEDWCQRARRAGNHELALIHAQAWKEVVAILDRLHLIGRTADFAKAADSAASANSDETMKTDLDELREDVETALSTARAELIPPTLDQVLIGSVERSRTPRVKVAFVLGLIDGEFPRAHEEDPMLGDRERETLTSAGRTLGPDSERRFTHERFLTYVALTRPSLKLVLSRPLIDSGGKSAGPSSFFRAVTEAFPGLPISEARQGDHDRPAGDWEATTASRAPGETSSAPAIAPSLPEHWARRVVQSFHGACRGEDPSALGWALLGAHPLNAPELVGLDSETDRRRVAKLFGALNWPRKAELDPTSARGFWTEDPGLPVTALEDHALCPFRFYAARMLRLQPPRDPIPGSRELGQLRHVILHELFLRLRREGKLRWDEVDLEAADRIVDESADLAISTSLADQFGRDALTGTVVRHVAGEMKIFVRALATMARRYGFAQVLAEHRFGSGEKSVLSLKVDAELTFTLRGMIDRVDELRTDGAGAEDGGAPVLVLYDYKSGKRRLDPARLYYGVDLQPAAYALALEMSREGGGAGSRGPARVEGLFYWPLSIGVASAEGEDWAEPATRRWFKTHMASGLFNESIADALDKQVGPGEKALAFNFAKTKNGSLSKQRNGALPSPAFKNFLVHARRLLTDRAAEIARGEVAVRPLSESGRKACDLCDFAAVCRIATLPPDAFRTLPPLSFKEFRRRLETGDDQAAGHPSGVGHEI